MYKKTLKAKTHAFILLSAVWMLFSGFAVMDWLDVHRTFSLNPNTMFDFVIWGLQLLLISLALYFWQVERPKPVLCVDDSAWKHIATHACAWILFANLPLFAFLQGSLAVEMIIHCILVLVGVGGFILLHRMKKTAARIEF